MTPFNPLRYAVVYIYLNMIRTFKSREILKYVRLSVNSACSARCMSYGIVVFTQAVSGNSETFLSSHKFHEIQNISDCDEITNKI
jgi:hypothetical protein